MTAPPNPAVRQVRVRAVRVPMPDPHQTASGVVSESPLALTDLTVDGGSIRRSIVFTYTAQPSSAFGCGIEWDETAVGRFLA
jgi:hypothetical protein